MAITNWVNEPKNTVTTNFAGSLTDGSRATGSFSKSATASGGRVSITYQTGASVAGPMSIYVSAGADVVGVIDNSNPGATLTLIGTHTAVDTASANQQSTEYEFTKAFGGDFPDDVTVYVYNNTGAAITLLVVSETQGHYVTT